MRKLLSGGRQHLGRGLKTAVLGRWALWGLLLLAFALRMHALGSQELTFDEVTSVFIADRSPPEMLAYVRGAVREHPPLYYLLLSLWMPLVGKSEFAVRYLSVIIGMATVAAVYRGLRKASRPGLALLGTLLLAVSPFHVGISQDARMYALLALWSLLSVSAFLELVEPKRERGWSSVQRPRSQLPISVGKPLTTQGEALTRWGLFWLATGLGVFTHYFMVFVLLAENLYLILNWRRFRSLLPRWLVVQGALGGLLALWAVLSPGLSATLVSLWNRGTASALRWSALARALNGLYLGATQRPNWWHLGLCLIVTALGLVPFRFRRSSRSHRAGPESLLCGLLMGVPVIAVLALPEQVSGRYLTTALPASVVAMAGGLDGLFVFLRDRVLTTADARLRMLAAWFLPLGLLCGILFIDIQAYSTVYYPSGESFRDKMDYVSAHAWPDDGLLLHGPWQDLLLSYYDPGPLKSYTVPLQELQVDATRVDATLEQVLESHERLWVSYGSVDPVDPDWIVSRWLHQNAHQVLARRGLALYYRSPAQDLPAQLRVHPPESAQSAAEEYDSRLFVPLTTRDGDGYDHVTRLDTSFAQKLQLRGVALSNVEVTSGEAVLVLSQWHALRDVPPGLVMRLELVGPGGQDWQHYQFAVGPTGVAPQAWGEGDEFTERRGLVVPIGTPPGDYQLRLRLISAEGIEWLPQHGDPLTVGRIRVEPGAPLERGMRALPGRGLQVDFGGTLSLVGYAPWGHDFTQGNPILFDLYWQALETPEQDYELEIEVLRGSGSVLTKRRVQPVADWFPTGSWKAHDLLKGHYAVPLPADASPGAYRVRLSVVARDGSPLSVEGTRTRRVLDWWNREETLSGTDLELFGGRIEARPRRYHPPAMDHAVDVVLSTGDGQRNLRLLGYDVASTLVEPGGLFELTLYWKTLRRMERVYAVFNHLVAPDGTPLAQQDGWPQQGTYHTSQWLPGEVVEDHYIIQIPPDASAAQYVLRVGMYDAATGERLPIAVDGTPVPEGYVELTTVTVSR